MKNITLIYCGEDTDAAKELAGKLRSGDQSAMLCSTEYFVGAEMEAQRVIIMPDVPFFRAMPIKNAYPMAEYSPPDEFTPKQVAKALDMPIKLDFTISKTQIDAAIAEPKRKRGRPRKVAA